MATVIESRGTGEARGDSRPVSWGAILAGTAVALGVWILLSAFGFAAGLSSVSPNDPIGGEALFTGIWAIVTPLVALFAGGWTAARLAPPRDRTAGVLHGATLWAVTTVLGVFAVTSLLGSLASAAAGAGTAAVGAASQGNPVSQLTSALNIDSNELLAPVNQKLQEQGKPTITADQLGSAIQGAVSASLRQGRIDANILEQQLAANTNLSRTDVRELAQTVEQQAGAATTQIQQGAVAAAGTTAKVFWGIFIALLLGLISSVLGAVTGSAGHDKRRRSEVRTTTTTPVAREVHP